MHKDLTHPRTVSATLRIQLTSCAAAVLLVVACRPEREPDARSATADTAAADRSPRVDTAGVGGVWYGVTDDGMSQRAWVLSLERSPVRGFIYSASSGAELCDIQVDTADRVAWNTGSAFGRVRYAFDGRHADDELRGTLRRTSERGDTGSVGLALRRVEPAAPGAPAGVYSSMRYSEDSGDLLGRNLLLLDGNGRIGALTIAEGTPGPPHPLLDSRRGGDTLRFAIQTTSFDRRGTPIRNPKRVFTAIFAGDSVHLQEIDAVEGQVLTRRGSIGDFLRRQPVRACP
jgi:hypothetical protein